MKQTEWDIFDLPIGEAIFITRSQLGLTHKNLASKTGIHRNTISRVESGEYTPSIRVLAQISNALGLEVSKLVRRAEKIRPTLQAQAPSRPRPSWAVDNTLKVAAWKAVRDALKGGRLTRMPCEVCSETGTDAHHDDYNQPLDVRWLCPFHHTQHHQRVVAEDPFAQ